MAVDGPLAFFITWTVYGSHLQGDASGWRRRRQGEQLPQPQLAAWHRERLKHDVLLLSPRQRMAVESQCERHCEIRGWRSWAVSARSNHVHAVVTAPECSGKTVRDQLEAYSTRALREQWPVLRDRPVWTAGGDWVCVNSDDELDEVCRYVLEAQDRKGGGETGR
jgi:REP element-mobilizing transposase RayT